MVYCFLKKARKMGKMADQLLGQAGGEILDQGLGTIFGMATADWADRRQLRQQQKLQELQIQGQKTMTDYQMKKQLEMWDATNYEAQMKHIKDAGLNPALLYGKGGAGGATTGSAGGSVTGAQAPSGGGEIQAAVGMGIQRAALQNQQAQIDLMKAQTNKTNAETNKISGVDTDLAKATIQEIAQDVTNKKQQEVLNDIQISMNRMQQYEQNASQQDRLDTIKYEANQAWNRFIIINNDASISTETKDAIETKIKAESALASLQVTAAQEGIKLTQQQIDASKAQVLKWVAEVKQGWQQLDNEQQKIQIQKLLQEFDTNTGTQLLLRGLPAAIGTVGSIMSKGKSTTVIGGEQYHHHEHN